MPLNIKKYLVSQNASILEAMKVIEDGAICLAFVIDEEERLCGVLSDGDVRRALLEGHSLDSKISLIINKEFFYTKKGENFNKIMDKAGDFIKIVPVVNKNKQVVDFIKYDRNAKIPIASLSLMGNEYRYVTDALLSTWISSSGQYINEFESNFAKFCECKYGVAVSNGTVALHLALTALGIGEGDEVIVPDLTFAASINTVFHAKAKPVIVDVEEKFWTMDPKEVEKAITPKTKAIMPVHIYGQPCDMEKLMKIAKKHKLFVVEDCAEAHGAKFNGKKVGSIGDIGCFSFYANKVITTGEGGMCVTNSKKLYDKMKVLRDHGMSKERKYWHEEVGFNYRMTNIQAAIGCAQLEKIENNLNKRKELESRYKTLLSGIKFLDFPKDDKKRARIVWLVSALVTNGKRDELIAELFKNGIDTRPFFYSLGTMPPYKDYLFSNNNSKRISAMGINFPTHDNLNDKELERIHKVLADLKP